jgi:putative pyoverdin transport system ATP-binding/permease protein
MNLMRFLLRSSGRIVILPAIAGAAGGVMGIALIALIQRELARDPSSPRTLAWAFFAVCVASAVTRAIAQIAIVKLGQGAIAQLSLQLVRRTLVLPLRAFEKIDSSALLSALTEDIAVIANAMVGVPQLCINIPIVIACLLYTGWLAPLSMACGVVFAGLAIIAYVIVSARGMKALRRARESQALLVGHFRALIGGFRELKVHRGRREAYLAESLEPTMASARKEMVSGLAHFAVGEGWGQLAFFGFIGFLLFAAPQIEPISRPTLVSAVLVVLYLMTPLDIVLTWLPVLGRAQVSLQRVQALIPTLERLGDPADIRLNPGKRLALRDSVCLEGVSFTYHDGDDETGFTLGPIDLTLRAGEIVVLAGGNGTGKTTLVKLISGLYAPESGILRLDGRELGDGDREAYRQLFSVIFADGYLFPDFLGLGAVGVEARAREGLEQLGLAHQVSIRGSSFSTLDLSQGQRRRLALLGALLEDRPICIFDEWAANQDPSFKQLFYLELLPELRAAGKALLVISHDESHFDVADRIVRLQDGRLQDGRLLDEPALGALGTWASQDRKEIAI